LDNGITYKVSSYAVSASVACAYKSQINNTNICAVKSVLDPYITSSINLTQLMYMPTPYPYCNDAQVIDPSYACISTPAGSQILTRQDNMCVAQLIVNNGGGGSGGG
jgi:hypothetical protein